MPALLCNGFSGSVLSALKMKISCNSDNAIFARHCRFFTALNFSFMALQGNVFLLFSTENEL